MPVKRPLARAIMMTVIFVLTGSLGYSQIISTTPASRCGEGNLTLYATAATGTITWYAVPFYGTPIATGGSYTAVNLVVTTTFYVDALDESGCSLNPGSVRVPVIGTISANSLQAIIFYSSSTFCKSIEGQQDVTRTGTAGGTFTVDPAGLTLDPSTGAITPGTSQEGTYTVTYTVVPQEGCIENPASTMVTITEAPEQPVISYAGSPWCSTHEAVPVNRTGATGGTYTASPSGLAINVTTGVITPANSASGTYTVTYFVPGAGGCNPMTATTSVTVLQLPTASISYSSPFTRNQEDQLVTLNGTGAYTGGVYSSTAGLTINSATGVINPSTSDAGTYTVTYTLAAVAPCAEVFTTTEVSIYPLPTATISGSINVCQNATEPEITFTGADGTPPYTFNYTLNEGPELSITTSSGNSVTISHPTIIAGTYEYELTGVSDATTSYQTQTGTATITVNELPVALFEYTNSPFCSNGTDPLPTFLEGGAAGTFTSTAGLVINASTGEIDLSGSTPGTYTVTNTIAASLGCGEVIATGPVTITQLPVASLEYSGSPYCTNGTDPAPTGSGIGDGTFSSVPLGIQFVNTSTGVIDLSASTPGTYEIVNTIAAANGCDVVTATFSSITIDSPSETPSINYSGSPYCNIITSAQPVELTWPTGGEYTSDPSGLTLNSINCEVVPSTSTPGTYTVTYTVGGNGGCLPEMATTEVTVKESPLVTNPSTKTICSSTSTDVQLTSSMPNTIFGWTIGEASLDVENASAGSGDYIDQIPSNTNFNNPASIEYIITPHSEDNGCDGDPFTITVTLRPAVFLLITDPPAVCSPNTIDLTDEDVTAGSASGLTFTYWNDADATSPVTNPESVDVTQRFYIKATDLNGCYDIKPVQTVVNPLPTATISGTTTVCQNDVAPLITFTGADASEPYTFTYKINGGSDLTITTTSGNTVTVEAPTNIAGEFTYSLVSVQDGSATACNQTQTGSATVTVDPTSVAGTINGSTSVCSGSNSTELSLTGYTGEVVKWQYSTDGFVSDINDIATTSTSYTASDLAASTSYRVIVQSGVCPSETSAPATVTVTADPAWANHTAPAPTALCVGESVSFNIEVSGGLGGSITWIRSETSGGEGVIVSSPDTPPASGTYYYRPHYTPTGSGCDLADGTETMVVVDQTSAGGTVSEAQTICSGSEPTQSLTLSGHTGNVVKWQKSNDPAFTAADDIAETSTTLAFTTIGTLTSSTYYRAVVKNGVCDEVPSTSVLITVDPTTVGGSVSDNQTICYNTVPEEDLVLSGHTGSVLKWQKSGDAAFTAAEDITETSTTLSYTTIGALTSSTYYRAVVKSGVCSEVPSTSVLITVDPASAGGTVTDNQTICYNTVPEEDLTLSGHTGNVIKWQKAADANFTAAEDIAETSTTLSYTTIGALTSSTYYRAVVKSGVCNEANSSSVLITVHPFTEAPTGNSSQSFYIEDSPTVASLSATGTNIQWYVASSGGTALETTTPLVNGTHYYASQTVNGCESTSRLDVTVSVNPVRNTTLGTNYPTIQDAIDDPLTLDGHAIQVANGSYNLSETVAVTKEVTLTGNTTTPANVVINAPTAGGAQHSENSAFMILADNVTIQGFKIQGALHTGTAQNAGIYLDDPRYLTNPGLSNITITNNEITNNGYGIVVQNARNSTISYNDVYGNKKVTGKESESGVGIVVFGREEGSSDHTYNLTIDHNTVYNNETEGIRVDASSDVDPAHWVNDLAISISNNEVYNNGSTIGGVDKYIGIKSAGWSKGVTLTGNEIYGHLGSTIDVNSGNAGIQLFASNDWEISGTNLIHDNLNGIFFGYSTFDAGSGNHVITGNEFYDNVRGISIDDGFEASTELNKIYDNNVSTFSGIGYTPYGVYNSSTNAFDASSNWWGHASGPAVASNPCGTGDDVSANVTYETWYTDAALTSLTGTVINTGLSVGGTGSVCSGTETNITVALSQTGVNYQLRNDNANELVGSAVAGTGGTINLPTGALTTSTTFNVYATHATTGCSAELTETEVVTVNSVPSAPGAGSHVPGSTQIQWNWNTVSGADGYKWSATNDFSSATDNGTSTNYTQTGLTCNTSYTSYVWAYTGTCHSSATTLSSSTSSCTHTGGLTHLRGNNGTQYDFVVTGTTTGSIWGGCSSEDLFFTDDTALETAAVHGGWVAAGQTMTVRVVIAPGLSSYSSCTANGVTSSSFASWPGSYYIISSW